MALIAGYGLEKIRYHWMGLLLLVALSVEGIANQQHDFRIKEKEYRILNLEKDLDRVSRRHDLIFINSGAFPTPIYFSHRKGWIGSNEEISNEQYISKLKKEGLKYIVILKRSFGTEIALNQYLKVMENEDYCIYKLQPR
jgi:hypothetical protein